MSVSMLNPEGTVTVVAGKPSIGKPMEGIQWAPLSQPERLGFNGTTAAAVLFALETAFGHVPIRLNRTHLETLRGMMIGAGEGKTPYAQLHRALEQFGELEITTV